MFVDPPALRTRASRMDSRVQLVEIVPPGDSPEPGTRIGPSTPLNKGQDDDLSSKSKEKIDKTSHGVESRIKRKITTTIKTEPPSPPTSSSKRIKIEPLTPTKSTTLIKSTRSSTRPIRSTTATKRESSPLLDIEDLSPPPPPTTPTTPSTSNAKPKKEYTPAKIRLSLDKPHPEPPRWKRQYELIEKMRERIVAPVDTLGCETPNRERTDDPKTIRFHMLISLCLSSQTKDPVTSQAVTNLHSALPGGLTAASLAFASPELISSCINKVGFWRRKTEYIKEAAQRIVLGGLDEGEERTPEVEGIIEEEGDIPRTLGGLCKLKGVGPKMAFLALQCAWNINAGVGVDVHVHRITNRLGWHKPKTTEPEQTRLNLQSWLPPRLFKPINHVLVGFGQVVCLPVGPRCDVCLLGKEKICPSRVANVNTKNRKVVEFGFLDDEGNVKAAIELEIGPSEEGFDSKNVKDEDDETGITTAEELADVVMQELADEKGLKVVKAE